MINNIPQSFGPTVVLGGKVLHGLTEGVVPTKIVTAAVFSPALASLTTAGDAFFVAREAKQAAYDNLSATVVTVQAFIAKAVEVFTPSFGWRWSAAWIPVGFDRNLSLPRLHSQRHEVLRRMTSYLTAHPEAEDVGRGITRAAASAFLASYMNTFNVVGNATTEARTKMEARTAAMAAVHKLMRDLVRELKSVIALDDPRWKQFGFNIPADPSVPEAVQNLVVSPGLVGGLSLEWPESTRAERYLVEIMVGAETEFHRVAKVYDANADLTGLTPGAAVKVRVIAANDGGESAPSAVVQATVPALAIAA